MDGVESDWIEEEISRELSKLCSNDLDESTESDYNEFLSKFKPPSSPDTGQLFCLTRYLSVRKAQTEDMKEGLEDILDDTAESPPAPPNDLQLLVEDEEEIVADNDLSLEIKAKEVALLAIVNEKERFELQLKDCKEKVERERIDKEIHSAIVIQSYWRSYKVRSQILPVIFKERKKEINSAIAIQSYWRGYRVRSQVVPVIRKEHLKLISAAATIQRMWKLYRLRQQQLKNSSAKKIQICWRSYRQRVLVYLILAAGRDQIKEREIEKEIIEERKRENTIKERLQHTVKKHELVQESFQDASSLSSQDLHRSCDLLMQSQDPSVVITSKSCDQLLQSRDQKNVESELAQMAALKEIRSQEETTAQLSRDRMNQLMSRDQISVAMETTRSEPDYKMRLEHSSSPLSYYAWQGVVEERRKLWQERRTKINTRSINRVTPYTPHLYCSQTKTPLRTLTDAQLLASSPQGTAIDQVTVVHIFKTRNGSIDFSSLSRCPNLRSLSLINCSLISFNKVGGANPRLQEIILSSNLLEVIDCSELTMLRFLDLSNNKLSSIHGLQSCKNLLELNFDDNRIARIGGLENCVQLQELSANGNLIINSSGIANLPNLHYLSLAENHLPAITGLEACCYLQFVDVQQNNLQECIPVSNNVLLREINLIGNSISSITSIEEAWLPHLQTLKLSSNCITGITSLTCCIMLSTLDLRQNSLYDLPTFLQSVRGCYRLSHLCIDGNPITHEPKLKYHLLKALPNLVTLDEVEINHKKRLKLPKEIISHPLVELVNRQLCEQDELKIQQTHVIEKLQSDSPSVSSKILDTKVNHCIEYHNLLKRHLSEQIQFDGLCIVPLKDERISAAILIQKYWKGYKCRKSYQAILRGVVCIQSLWRGYYTRKVFKSCLRERRGERERKVHQAAVRIQACFRGYSLRKKLKEILNLSSINCDDEINIDEITFDETLFEDIKPFSPTDEEIDKMLKPLTPPISLPVDKATMPKFTLPGAVEEEVPLEVWLVEESRHMSNGGIKETHPCQETRPHQKTHPQTSYKETIMSEWGFDNQTTADLMIKRANRHKKLQRTARQRNRLLSDPVARFNNFQRTCPTSNTPPAILEGTNRKESSPKFSSPSYQWVHHKKVIHQQLLSATPTSSQSSLPQMELHVLAGHAPRLMTSKAQNELVKNQTKSLRSVWN